MEKNVSVGGVRGKGVGVGVGKNINVGKIA
jgi:hypothetical protein